MSSILEALKRRPRSSDRLSQPVSRTGQADVVLETLGYVRKPSSLSRLFEIGRVILYALAALGLLAAAWYLAGLRAGAKPASLQPSAFTRQP
ncbi:MAG TPA: hypothetical protein VH701_25140 [Vicinamibacterales bacterium]|jgi:hypothetical protein